MLAASFSAHAEYTGVKCIRYANEELNAMTIGELKTAIKENQELIDGFSSFSFAERSERNKCLIQNQRITTILGKKLHEKLSSMTP